MKTGPCAAVKNYIEKPTEKILPSFTEHELADERTKKDEKGCRAALGEKNQIHMCMASAGKE